MVTKNEIRESIERLNVGKRGGHRAPHKPLLLLVSMARAAQDGDRRFSFAEVDEVLVPLLREFGKPGARPAPELPFWHLQTDGLWELQHAERPVVAEPSDFPGRRALRDGNYVGALPADVFKVFAEDPEFRREMGLALLRTHFPETLHQDVLDAVGLNLEADLVAQRRRRDPRFRLKVIRAYERRCAVCGYGVWLEEQLVGIEAAHIRWHQALGALEHGDAQRALAIYADVLQPSVTRAPPLNAVTDSASLSCSAEVLVPCSCGADNDSVSTDRLA